MEIIQWIVIAGIILALILSVYNSWKARRSSEHKVRALYAAKMNIYMGIMLILMAVIQILMFTGDTVRVVIGSVFLLLGLFNLFAGIRNHSIFSK
ncbi:hypothetical protein DNH61_17695 [Paenibacillus sambharensis]|uniref:YtpI-like protein n=1 Tax=Paenibacillus sambharensis TaxID=1803190 RepID=A0A2W1L7Y2_9BACL|nr:YtpI family protein [Paenibacillus sambharensis]PZD94250.1 hypothetical protein DNH61_17695 [Paenibacillus sambharensis]